MPWQLASSGPERLPKIVYARFRGGDAGRETYTDDIILDEVPPTLLGASIAGSPGGRASAAAAKRPRRVRVRARDANSGVARVQVSKSRSARGATTKRLVSRTRKGKRRLTTTVRMRIAPGRVWVRVADAAGNFSRWRRAA